VKRKIAIGAGIGVLIAAFVLLEKKRTPPLSPPLGSASGRGTETLNESVPLPVRGEDRSGAAEDSGGDNLQRTKAEMLAQLNQKESTNRSLPLPVPPPIPLEEPTPEPVSTPALSTDELARLEGRKKRAVLPMGVVLEDRTPVYAGPDFKKVVCGERICFRGGEEKSRQIRYFSSSASGRAGLFVRATRGHWGIENSQHWRLDVFFREDLSRVSGNAAVSLGVFRRLALSLLKRETSEKVGVQTKRQMAGWDVTYLEKVLAS